MIDEATAPRPARAWLAVAGLLGLGALLVATGSTERWDWQPGRVGQEPWRAWTAAFVHWSGLHLGLNLAGTLAVAALGSAAGCPRRAALAWALAWPLTHLALLAQPGLLHYGGLSGVLHAGVAVAAAHLLVGHPAARPAARRAIGAMLLAGLAIKVIAESPWDAALRRSPGWDIAIAPLAHAAGSVCGLLCLAMVALPLRAPPRT